MARWASLIERRRSEKPVLFIDAGDFFPAHRGIHQEIDDRYFFKGMKLIGYDAAGVGEQETAVGLEKAGAAMAGCRVPLVSANIIDKARKVPAAPQDIVKDIGGERTLFGRKGGVRVGIFSVALPGFIYRGGPAISKKYYVVDPKLSALEAVTKLRSRGCDLVIAISHQGWRQSLDLARDVPGIDLVLNGHPSHKRTFCERVGRATVVDPGEKEYSFTEVSVTFSGDSIAASAIDVCGALLSTPGDQRFIELQRDYEKEVKEFNRSHPPRRAGARPRK
jgi:5'-nucleotidase/UDP-sugar diphosphatase